jgi:hypothetical protein
MHDKRRTENQSFRRHLDNRRQRLMIVETAGYITRGVNAKHSDKLAIIVERSDTLLGCAEQIKRLRNDGVAGRSQQPQATIGLCL